MDLIRELLDEMNRPSDKLAEFNASKINEIY